MVVNLAKHVNNVATIGKWIVTLGTLASIGGINIAKSFVTPRGPEALDQDKVLASALIKHSSKGLAAGSIIVTAIPTILIAMSGSLAQLALFL